MATERRTASDFSAPDGGRRRAWQRQRQQQEVEQREPSEERLALALETGG